MGIENDFRFEIKNISSVCGIDPLPNFEIRNSLDKITSEFDENIGSYIIYHPPERRVVGRQDSVLHESAHVLNICYQKNSNQFVNIDMIRKLVVTDWEKGIIADNFLNLCSEIFSRYFSAEMVASYFGLDRSNMEVLKEVSDSINEKNISLLKEKYLEIKKRSNDLVKINNILTEEGINTSKDHTLASDMANQCQVSRSFGEKFGEIFGQWFVVENVLPKEIMTHTPIKLMNGLEQLFSLDKFPKQISDVFKEANAF